MAEIRININKKSFVSFILCFIMLFSILAPTVNAATSMNEEELQLEREMQKREEELKAYEEKNHITGDVIDFSSIDFSKTNSVTSKTLSSQGDSDVGSYQIVREGKEYIITLENVIAKKIILPRDDADKDGKQVMDEEGKTYNVPAYTGKPRENHITIILKGNNIITGYGMEGYPVKGIKIEGSGNLTIHAFSQPVVQKVNTQKGDTWVKSVELPYYTKAGISVETGDRTYENKDKDVYKDENSLVFAGTGNITIHAPEYHGILNNGDIKFKSGNIKIEAKKSAISGYRIFVDDEGKDKNFGLELISEERAFYDRPTLQGGNYIIFASQSKGISGIESAAIKTKKEIENSYTSYRYVSAQYVAEEKNVPQFDETTVQNGEVYCHLPVVTVTDDTAIDTITVNGIKMTSGYQVNTAKKKVFTVPASNSIEKEIVVTDIFGNEAKISLTAYEYHQLSEPRKTLEKLPTCTEDGYHMNEYNCTICGEYVTKVKVIDQAFGHHFEDWKITENGKERTCSTCGYVEEDKTKNIANTTISLLTSSYVYDGKKKEPEVFVKDGSKQLSAGKDYTVTYSNNLLAGIANVKITGINQYKNTVNKNFTIAKADNVITASNFTKNYSANAQSFSIGASQKGNGILTYASDNRAVTVNHLGVVTISAGFAGKVTITMRTSETSEYKSATKQITITVNKADNAITASSFTKTYSANAQSFSIGATQKGNSVLTYSSNNKNVTVNSSGKVTIANGFVGKATITITANATTQYNKATKQITITVNKANNTITASNITKTYSSKAQSFSMGATQKGNAKLTYSSNNKNVKVSSSGKVTIAKGFIGKATITITANATTQYNKATKQITITVNPASVKISKLSNSKGKKMAIKWKKSTVVTGYQIQYSTDKSFKKNVKTTTITKKTTTSKTVSKLTKKKKYYVRIRTYKTVSGVKYYSGWSASKNITIKK